ncbi:hypothetical protein RB195_022329 [Necator americanus]
MPRDVCQLEEDQKKNNREKGIQHLERVERHSTSRWTDLDKVARMELWNSTVRRQQRKMFIGIYIHNKFNKYF